MNNANYVINTNEAVLIPTENNKVIYFIKHCTWIIVFVLIMGSIVFQDNLFKEISWTGCVLLVALVIKFGFYNGKKEDTPSPMELRFYDDYLEFYLPKRYYSNRVTRKEMVTFKYADISKCVLKQSVDRIHIYGDGKSVWYNYKKDGTLPSKPTEERTFTGGMVYFNIRFATDVDFKKEIEEHSPLKLVYEP